jgi:PAS domain S-box-containing protein
MLFNRYGHTQLSEDKRLSVLDALNILDTPAEDDFDEIVALASRVCQTPIGLISFIDSERQWFKSIQGIDDCSETDRSLSFCNHAIINPNEPFIVEDAREDVRFYENELVVGPLNVVFYAGFPLKLDDVGLGTLCVIDHKPRKLDALQIEMLQFLAKRVVGLLEERRKSRLIKRSATDFIDSLLFASPFLLVTDLSKHIRYISPKLSQCVPSLAIDQNFAEQVEFTKPFDLEEWIGIDDTETSRLFFFQSSSKQKFKFSAKKNDETILFVCTPVINSAFPISNYNLKLSDFANHDYIAEFLFLQESTNKSLRDSQLLIEKVSTQNKVIQQAQNEIQSIAKFPEENPNPILRFAMDGDLMYKNRAATESVLELINVQHNRLNDKEILAKIAHARNHDISKDNFIIERESKYLSCAVRMVDDAYYNVYLTDITEYIVKIKSVDYQLDILSDQVHKQKAFYEYILDNLPADVAVFDVNHKYVYVNPKGIKDDQLRACMIGKDDYDYCQYRGISNTIADQRRDLFKRIIAQKEFVSWEDAHVRPDGSKQVVFRQMGPLYDDNGNLLYVVGYGTDITERKKIEDELRALHKNLRLRDSFMNRVSDAIQVANADGQLIYLNETASKRLGIPLSSCSEYRVWDFEKLIPDENAWKHHLEEMRSNKLFQATSEIDNKEDGQRYFVEITVTHQEIDGSEYLIASSRDVTQRISTELKLVEKSNFQQILTKLSSRFINLPISEMDQGIQEALMLIGEFFKVDRAYIFDYHHDLEICRNTYEWCSPSVEAQIHNLQRIPFDDIKEWMSYHLNGQSISISDVKSYPNGPIKEGLERQDILSVLALPMFDNNTCVGFVGFDSVLEAREFSSDEEDLLYIFAEMIVNLYNRAFFIAQIESSRNDLEQLNSGLEKLVDEKTSGMNNLLQTLYTQDKLALIGEITAGIAHDLNTPLGVIKIGSENVRYSLQNIFGELLDKMDFQSFKRALDISQINLESMPIGGLQAMKETQKLAQQLLILNVPKHVDCYTLAQSLISVRLGIDQQEVIQEILELEDPLSFLELVFQLRNTLNFLDTMQTASIRSAEVVKTLKSYLRAGDDQFISLNIRQSLRTVVQIFNHELKHKYTLTFDVDENLQIKAVESKLFQLWSNLIKNALEAMPNGGQLDITGTHEGGMVRIEIANNGQMIPQDIQERIFEKFFTTKGNQNGTGLGLSIVKKVADEHGAKILLNSDENRTAFAVLFPTAEQNP